MGCATCHCILEKKIFEKLPKPSNDELDILDLADGSCETSRLGCQVKVARVMNGMQVQIIDHEVKPFKGGSSL